MEIKVLHFVPQWPKDDDDATLLDLYLNKLGEEAEVHAATLSPVSNGDNKGYQKYCIGSGKADYGKNGMVNLLALQKRFLQLLYHLMPQVVHIHGSYHFINSRIALWSRKRGFPVVFSPYGGMNPDFIDKEYGMRTWKLLSYQKKMVKNASCTLISDPKEGEYIKGEKLTERIAFIEDPRKEDHTELDDYADCTLQVYQKVLDTDMGKHIDRQSQEAMSALLHLSLAGDVERQPLCPEDILNLRSITPKKWRDIFLYAAEQGVTGYINDGIARAQLAVPPSDASAVNRFPLRYPKDSQPLSGDKLLTTNIISRKAIERKLRHTKGTERTLCTMLHNLRYLVGQSSLSLRHLCDLYEVLRHNPIDEDALDAHLREQRIHTFTRRVCQVLHEAAYLDEGYMPVPALDDKGTEKIRTNLTKY